MREFLPFLLPLRRESRKIWCFYQKMKHDGNRYARRQAEERLPYIQYECTQGLINPDSGYDIQYQYNKAHNLKVVSRRMQQLIIEPGEVFSFWQLARGADHDDPYLPGLGLHDGKIVPVHGGGLCFMSELLYWMVLHTPLTVIEKHPHLVMLRCQPIRMQKCRRGSTRRFRRAGAHPEIPQRYGSAVSADSGL